MNFKIAVLRGDGIGPEIADEALRILQAVGRRFKHEFQFVEAYAGGEAADMMIVRELTSGIYFGERGSRTVGGERRVWDTESYTEGEVARISHGAFHIAQGRPRRHVTLVAKSNILDSSILWRDVFTKVAAEYADVTHDYLHVDNAAMQIVVNPRQFDVVLTNNMFGDILSDEASVLAGSLGMLGSASLNAVGFG